MCLTCGCAGDGQVSLTNAQTGHTQLLATDTDSTHSHTLEDGTVITHSHFHSHSHDSHSHPTASEVHAKFHGRKVNLETELLQKNNLLASQNRHWFQTHQILALNLVSSPGAGKTTLLTRTIEDLKKEIVFSVIEGDQETLNDVHKIRATGCQAVQINTGTGCHLEANMVQTGYQELNPPPNSILAIENVGNLVCPALFDLGEAAKVAILSVTEGEDKPIKYPHMFRASQVMILTKIDLLPYLQFDVARCIAYAQQVNPNLTIFSVSATTGEGLNSWYDWLRARQLTVNPQELTKHEPSNAI